MSLCVAGLSCPLNGRQGIVMRQRMQLVRLAGYPDGIPEAEDFEVCTVELPRPATGQVLLRNLWLSLDPYLRPLLAGRYMVPRPPLGAPVPGHTVARIEASDDPRFPTGALVVADATWSEYAAVDAEGLRLLPDDGLPPSTALGVLGIPGLTAWAGMRTIAKPEAGETVLVSTAAGAVGSVAGQLARIAGCRVVGIAGNAEKCRMAVEEFGFDACVSHRSADLVAELRVACPDGIDVYFDNVGVHVLAAALTCLRHRARVVLCGLSGQYNDAMAPPGPPLGPVIGARARMEGLVVYDHLDRYPEFHEEVSDLVRSGRLRYREHIHEGLAQAPRGFAALMRGENQGKALVRVQADGP